MQEVVTATVGYVMEAADDIAYCLIWYMKFIDWLFYLRSLCWQQFKSNC
jgi:hypothetical protein